MNKSTLVTIFVIIGCIVTLVASYKIHQARLESVYSQAENLNSKDNDGTSENKSPVKEKESTETKSLSADQISSLTANMSDEASSLVTSRLEAGEKIQLLVIGSSSIEEGNPSYGEILSNDLNEAYDGWIETTILSYDGTTAALVEELDSSLIDWSTDYDLVLLEGMNLKNNGAVIVEDAIEHIDMINRKIKQNVSDSVLIVHPSQPLTKAIYYPGEVDSFKSYLTNRGYTYIDHWTEWPVGNEAEMNTYLTEDSAVNEKGAVLWASALSTFFTGK